MWLQSVTILQAMLRNGKSGFKYLASENGALKIHPPGRNTCAVFQFWICFLKCLTQCLNTHSTDPYGAKEHTIHCLLYQDLFHYIPSQGQHISGFRICVVRRIQKSQVQRILQSNVEWRQDVKHNEKQTFSEKNLRQDN